MRFPARVAGCSCCLMAALLAGGCGSAARAPVLSRDGTTSTPSARAADPAPQRVPAQHVVSRGDTLFSIAWRYGLDYRDVAAWNGIREPFVIVPGQSIRLHAPPRSAPRQAPPVAATPKPQQPPARSAPAPRPTTPPVRVTGDVQWQWPANGRVLHSDSLTSRKGVDISGSRGQAIIAAGAGSVVYSGSGLRGYGRLIIIKHNDAWLSAYAHNEQLMVKEGDRVSAGQQIATMGLGNDGRPVLHFEIRKDGKPVNPLDYLPKRPS